MTAVFHTFNNVSFEFKHKRFAVARRMAVTKRCITARMASLNGKNCRMKLDLCGSSNGTMFPITSLSIQTQVFIQNVFFYLIITMMNRHLKGKKKKFEKKLGGK